MGKGKGISVKVTSKPTSKPIKAKLSSNKGGIMTAKLTAIVNNNKVKANGKQST